MKPVSSSTIKAIGYDEKTKILTIQFAHGGHYEYQGVSPEQHKALMDAESIGGHFHDHIKQKHLYRKKP